MYEKNIVEAHSKLRLRGKNDKIGHKKMITLSGLLSRILSNLRNSQYYDFLKLHYFLNSATHLTLN